MGRHSAARTTDPVILPTLVGIAWQFQQLGWEFTWEFDQQDCLVLTLAADEVGSWMEVAGISLKGLADAENPSDLVSIAADEMGVRMKQKVLSERLRRMPTPNKNVH